MPYHTPGLSLSRLRGDPGPFALFAGLRLGTKIARKLAAGLARRVAPAVTGLTRRGRAVARAVARQPAAAAGAAAAAAVAAEAGLRRLPPIAPPGFFPRPGLKGRIQRFLPGGETGFIKRRRMNVTNPKALRRAIRRATGFAKLARRVLTFVDARPPRGRARFKKKR